jgi:integrase
VDALLVAHEPELDYLLAAAPVEGAVVYLTAATTGLRRAELKALRLDDLDLDTDAPTVSLTTGKYVEFDVQAEHGLSSEQLTTIPASSLGISPAIWETIGANTGRIKWER